MEREVRYCTTEDGVRIAYAVEGEGPALVMCPWFIESFQDQQFFGGLGRGRRLVRFDARGTGLSQRDVTDLSNTALVRDIEAVVRAVGLKRFSLWGPSAAGPRAIEYAARHPRQVDRLVLVRTFARLLDVFSSQMLEGLIQLARANWHVTARTWADMTTYGYTGREFPQGTSLVDWYRQSTTGEVVARLLEQNIELDVTGLLSRLKALTLVVSLPDDVVFPVALGQQLAAAIPNARFLPFQGRLEPSFDDPAVLNAVDAFLKEGEEPQPSPKAEVASPTPVRTVLFTDMAGSTSMMQRLGDERGREVLREHERITREVLKSHGGTEVKTMGDGFMASFGSVTKAVECAIALQRAFDVRNASLPAHPEPVEGRAEPQPPAHGSTGSPRAGGSAVATPEPIHIRIGLNAGEPIEEEGDLFGATVILAARIAAQAQGREILASDVVRGLCSGKGFLFADQGEFVAKGFEDPVRLFQVRWPE